MSGSEKRGSWFDLATALELDCDADVEENDSDDMGLGLGLGGNDDCFFRAENSASDAGLGGFNVGSAGGRQSGSSGRNSGSGSGDRNHQMNRAVGGPFSNLNRGNVAGGVGEAGLDFFPGPGGLAPPASAPRRTSSIGSISTALSLGLQPRNQGEQPGLQIPDADASDDNPLGMYNPGLFELPKQLDEDDDAASDQLVLELLRPLSANNDMDEAATAVVRARPLRDWIAARKVERENHSIKDNTSRNSTGSRNSASGSRDGNNSSSSVRSSGSNRSGSRSGSRSGTSKKSLSRPEREHFESLVRVAGHVVRKLMSYESPHSASFTAASPDAEIEIPPKPSEITADNCSVLESASGRAVGVTFDVCQDFDWDVDDDEGTGGTEENAQDANGGVGRGNDERRKLAAVLEALGGLFYTLFTGGEGLIRVHPSRRRGGGGLGNGAMGRRVPSSGQLTSDGGERGTYARRFPAPRPGPSGR